MSSSLSEKLRSSSCLAAIARAAAAVGERDDDADVDANAAAAVAEGVSVMPFDIMLGGTDGGKERRG